MFHQDGSEKTFIIQCMVNESKSMRQGSKKTFQAQFLVNKWKSMHFSEKFRLENFFSKLNFEQV